MSNSVDGFLKEEIPFSDAELIAFGLENAQIDDENNFPQIINAGQCTSRFTQKALMANKWEIRYKNGWETIKLKESWRVELNDKGRELLAKYYKK